MRWIKETILPRAATARASLITTALLALPRNVSPSPRLLLSIGLALLLGSTGEAQEARFEACTDGLTAADNATGLLWERKTGEVGASVNCSVVACPNLHDVNNAWTWSDSGSLPDGGIFEDFLSNLNDATFGAAEPPSELTGCFAGHCDWRVPAIGELQTILIGPDASPGQNSSCVSAPCVDPDFTAQAGPTVPARYWSASDFNVPSPDFAWLAQFNNGFVNTNAKSASLWVRAVRAGSCPIAGTGNIRLIEGSLVPAAALVLANPSETLRLERGLLGQLGAGRSSGASGVVLTGGVLPVPEPGAVLLWAAGLLGLLALGRLHPALR